MRRRRAASSRLWLTLPLWLGLALNARALVIPARVYERHSFTQPAADAAVQASGELSGGRTGVSGWVEYRARTEATGWYRLSTRGDAPSGVEFAIDADEEGSAPSDRYFYERERPSSSVAPVGNVWLTAGVHRIRLTRYFWTGFPRISAIELQRASGDLAAAVQMYFPGDVRVFRSGECPALVAHGGGPVSGALQIVHSSQEGAYLIGTHTVTFERTSVPVDHAVSLDCTRPGFHRLTWRFNGVDPPPDAQPSLTFQVIDTGAAPSRSNAAPSSLVLSIDCAARAPDYVSGATRVRSAAAIMYRESADSGWIPFQRSEVAHLAGHAPPSWFAYALSDIPSGQRLRIEVDYPDDRPSTFAVAWRDAAPLQYVPAAAVETGREYRLSGTRQSLAFHVWARSPRSRLVFLPAHDGDRAACSAIRIFADSRYSTTRDVAPAQARRFLNWYEEGENFTSLYGPSNDDAQGFNTAVERWFMQADDAGVNTLMPTVAVYNFGMYPSLFNRSFSEPQRDRLRVLMLQAERFGLQVIPELHPRGDELGYEGERGAASGHLAISKDGRGNASASAEPNLPRYFNALDPGNQQWYVGMVRELSARYRDSPAFQGVSLRYMTWANPALNNLVSLEWGYDDATLARYRRETGSGLPELDAQDAGRFARRYDWLMAHEKSAWIAWRCAQLTRLFLRLRDALRESRPDLTLYLHVFGPSVDDAVTFQTVLREAGLDLKTLSATDGIVIVNSSFSYGRLEQDGVFFNADRDPLLNPSAMGATARDRNRPWLLPTSRYLEAIGELIAPPRELGLTNARPAWMSAASNPAGSRALERFAVLLAQTDAVALGDGGNNLTLGSTQVAQFAREFRKLPPVPFDDVPGASDPVTVRSFASPSQFIFYAVNREDYPVDIRITLSDGQVRELTLQGYELKVMQEDRGVRITGVLTSPPRPQRDRMARRIAWVQNLVRGKASTALPGADATLLGQALSVAQRALRAGHLWEARTALETSAVLRVFRGAGCFPPDLREQYPVESRCRSD